MKTIKLNSGYLMPVLGTGTNTFGKEGNRYDGKINMDTTELASSIEVGYRMIDTAISYRNEAVVGKAVKESGIDRSEFFLVSKIPGQPAYMKDEASIDAAVMASLEALQTDYIDLYLIHHPWDNLAEMLAAWKVLEKHAEAGRINSIGVSNFNEEQLAYLLDKGTIPPAVNQVESHPGKWNDAIIAFGMEQGVFATSWGPLSRFDDSIKAKLEPIANKYHKTWAQVLLQYQIDRDVMVIPKSHDAKRQAQNFDVFDFTLTEDEKAFIKKL
ncbi:aldo/keto reductase family protein [Fundicoccus culcitae]|uniref:Aldo/keto reductase n=1 Tax=Fundicoccus culcitae TaxID=2969821 RepID=A0ABY5P5C1_9LACT|nr:aldo/keto reductase [Fundicoccus culcitae]UUX33906.1 aldo/keto reductase [Fundicoccus culcitae]